MWHQGKDSASHRNRRRAAGCSTEAECHQGFVPLRLDATKAAVSHIHPPPHPLHRCQLGADSLHRTNRQAANRIKKSTRMGFGFLLPLGLSFPAPFLFAFCTSPSLQLLYYFFSPMEKAGSYHSLCMLLVSDLFSLGFPEAFVDELKSGGVCSSTHF